MLHKVIVVGCLISAMIAVIIMGITKDLTIGIIGLFNLIVGLEIGKQTLQ